jgi:lysozyme
MPQAAGSEVLNLRVFLLATLALAALIFAAPWLYQNFELAALGYEVKGVDVSHYQGEIDWLALRKSGVRFAYIKATEGASLRDPRFAENWQRSHDAGIARGAYHYFLLCKSGAEQAANFIATIPWAAQAYPTHWMLSKWRRARTDGATPIPWRKSACFSMRRRSILNGGP